MPDIKTCDKSITCMCGDCQRDWCRRYASFKREQLAANKPYLNLRRKLYSHYDLVPPPPGGLVYRRRDDE